MERVNRKTSWGHWVIFILVVYVLAFVVMTRISMSYNAKYHLDRNSYLIVPCDPILFGESRTVELTETGLRIFFYPLMVIDYYVFGESPTLCIMTRLRP